METPRTRLVRLALGGRPFPFLAGQAVDLGSHGQPERRPYSIVCSPGQARDRDWLEFLIQVRESGSPGQHLAALDPGALVDVGPPQGGFVLPDSGPSSNLLFIAGGTGIAPIRSMLWHALETAPGVRPRLLYSARGHREFAFAREFHALANEGRIRLRETITRSSNSGWAGYRGRIARAHLESLAEGENLLCLVCGPPSFAADMGSLLAELGVGSDRVLTETWG
ncbi:MAG: FAD-dependent oxidoreductase [Vicinamibacterales bacterium]